MDINKVFYEMETKYNSVNIKKYQNFFKILYNVIGFSLDEFIPDDVEENDVLQKFSYIRYFVLTYLPQHKEVFYNLLVKHGYRMELEIIDNLISLCKLDVEEIDDEIKSFVTKSPFIRNLKIDGKKILVLSDKYGSFEITSAKNYFKSNNEAYSLFTYGDVSQRCHSLSLCLIQMMEDANLVTALMPSYFVGTYYHTYIEDRDGLVVDGANQIVLPKEQYEVLFKPKKVISYKKSQLYAEYVDAVSKGKINPDESYYIPLALALTKGIK